MHIENYNKQHLVKNYNSKNSKKSSKTVKNHNSKPNPNVTNCVT